MSASEQTRPITWRPPSIEEVRDFLDRYDETTPNTAHWTHQDMTLIVRAYRWQEDVAQGLREDLRDAGREMREMASEIQALERRAEDAGSLW